jgi:acetyltransferase-like isoleucine patch superfamily enzyme
MIQRILYLLIHRTSKEKQFRKLSKNMKLGNGVSLNFAQIENLDLGESLNFRNYIHIWVGKKAKLKIGNQVFFNNYCSINCLESIEIGENTLFGEGVKIYDHNHQYSYDSGKLEVSHNEFSLGAVKIGENCWLGSNVVVLKGVTIGDNSIIGAGCVIHKDVPANSVVVNKQELIQKNNKN